MRQDQFLLQAGHFELAVVPVQRLHLLVVQPVGEAVPRQRIRLGEDLRIVRHVVIGAVDALHLERHPAAVSAQVVQELAVVARAAEAGNVGPHLLVAGIRRAFVHVAHGSERLQLVQLLALHLVQLFEAHQGEFRERQQVVARDVAAVRLQVEVAAQGGRQQVVQPGGLVDALAADEHQYLVVHRLLFEQGGQHRHEPFLEEADKELAILLDVYLRGQPSDVVGRSVPRGQGVHVFAKGVVQGHEVRLDHRLHVRFACRARLLAQASPHRVHLAVRQVLEFIRSFGSELIFAGHRVLAEASLPVQERFDVVHRDPPLSLGGIRVLPPRAEAARSVLLRVLVTRAQDALHVAVVVGEAFRGPSGRRLAVRPVGVQQVAHAHDVLVVVVFRVGDALVGEQPLRRADDAGQLPVGGLPLCGGCRLLWSADEERRRFGVEENVRVVRHPAQARRVLALLVVGMARQRFVVMVYASEGQYVQLLFRARLVVPGCVVGRDDAQSRSADGGVRQ